MEEKPQLTPAESPQQKFLPFWTLLVAGAVILALLVAAICVGAYWMRSENSRHHREVDALENQIKSHELEQAKAQESVKTALAQSRQQEVMAQIKTATNNLTKLLESVVRVNAEALELRNNAAGKAIAESPDLVAQARRIYESEIPNLPSRDDVVARLEGARRTQAQLTANLGTAYNPDADTTTSAQDAALWAEESLRKVSTLEAFLTRLMQDSQVKVSGQPLNAHSPTLEHAISQLDAADAGQRLQTIAKNTDQAKNAANETVADAEAKRIIEDAKLEADRILREANLRAASNSIVDSKTSVAVNQLQDEAQRIKLKEKAARPDIQAQLAPFLTPGYFVPPRGTGYDKKPMSYSKLQEMGALNPSMDGLRAFVNIAMDNRNDRPKLSREFTFVRWWGDPKAEDKAKALQQLMIELGPTFVDMGVMEK